MAFIPKAVTSGLPILLSNVEVAFSNTSATLYGMRRGGPNLPDYANAYTGVSTTTPTLSSLAALTYPPVNFVSANAASTSALEVAPSHATVTLYATTDTNGTVWLRTAGEPGGSGQSNTKLVYEGAAVDYDIRFLKTAGSAAATSAGSSLNVWYNLLTTGSKFWSFTTTGVAYNLVSCSGYVQVRINASPQTLINESHVELQAVQSL